MIRSRAIDPARLEEVCALREPGGRVQTNKAVVVNRGQGVVRKTYLVADASERVSGDVRSLTALRDRFGTVSHEGWSYGIVKVLDADPGARWIETEFLPGGTIASLAGPALMEAEFHVGVWLALYHRHVLGGKAAGPIFSDANLTNFIFDRNSRRLIAIDPGGSWGQSGHPYEDLAQHFLSCILTCRVSALGLRAVLASRRGYISVHPAHWGAAAYWAALLRVLARQIRALTGKSRMKLLVFGLILPVLAPTLALFAPMRGGRAPAD